MNGLRLRDYQEIAADFLYEHDRAMILAPVGAGKTAITLRAMYDCLYNGVVTRWLVIAPKRVCTDVWPVEQPKWAPFMKLAVAVGTPKQRKEAFESKALVVVTNYDNLQSLPDDMDFDGIVFDELTRLKNPSGARFKALNKVIDPIKIRWGLTGSFTSNGLEDVFGQCKIIDQQLLGRSKGAFMQKYFILMNKNFGEWAPRKGALPEVMQTIKPATFVLDAGEYADQLPPLHIVEMRCDMADRSHYEKMKKDFVVQFGKEKITAVSAAVVTQKLQQMSSGFVYSTETTASNTPGRMNVTQTPIWFSTHKFDMLDELLNENQRANTIIVYNYVEELAELKRRYPSAQTINDPQSIARWNEGEIELLLIHPLSAGHGLNLQHGGCKMVFVSLPWSLEYYEQTIGRLHRSGQKHDVWVYILITTKTIEERILGALKDKKALSEIAMEELT
jgi:SNF2 family DNA or RNA helicase